jgi:hypothetical protein
MMGSNGASAISQVADVRGHRARTGGTHYRKRLLGRPRCPETATKPVSHMASPPAPIFTVRNWGNTSILPTGQHL